MDLGKIVSAEDMFSFIKITHKPKEVGVVSNKSVKAQCFAPAHASYAECKQGLVACPHCGWMWW